MPKPKEEEFPNVAILQKMVDRQDVKICGLRAHAKASESYVDVEFSFGVGQKIKLSIPYHYRRTGICAQSHEEIIAIVENAYNAIEKSIMAGWVLEQEEFWKSVKKPVTKPFFKELRPCDWVCVQCSFVRKLENANWARRIQDIKELGYTLATDTNRYCNVCKNYSTHIMLLPLPRGGQTGYETISPILKGRIIDAFESYDAFEGKVGKHLLPDHKFPEIRWDEATREENDSKMTVKEMWSKFQLLSNQRNQQKREICRNCFQTGNRGKPFGIQFFYSGSATWPPGVPQKGREAEKGCIGCGWYDLETWRQELNKRLLMIKQ